jgi:hypothetical protein
MTEHRSGQDRRTTGGGRRSTDAQVREAYRQLDEAARLTREARVVLGETQDRMCDYFTPMHLSRLTGIPYDRVVRDTRLKLLNCITLQRGKRTRLYIKPADAVAWLTDMGAHDLVVFVTGVTLDAHPTDNPA